MPDEPVPGDTSAGPTAGTGPVSGRPRRRRLRIVLVVLGVVVALVVAGLGVGYVQLDRHIKTFTPRGISKHRPAPSVAGQNLLLIGSDTRAGHDGALGGRGSAVGRSDTVLLVHVYDGGRRATSVSIPRDALVDIPRCLLPGGKWSAPQHHVMFNEAFSVGRTRSGNPACTVNTVERLTHLRVDHTVIADFSGFAAMTRIVGGVQACLPNPVYQGDLDPNRPDRGRLIFHAGRQVVSGTRALQYVRLRHGVGDGSDIGRIRRQQAFLGSVFAKVRSEGLTPAHLLPLVRAATRYLTFDSDLGSARQLLSFALSLRHMSPDHVLFLTAPWRYAGARVALVHPDVDRLWAALKADQPVTAGQDHVRPARVTVAQSLAKVRARVSVVDASRVAGVGARTVHALRAEGLRVRSAGTGPDRTRTVVTYPTGRSAQARALASAFVGAVTRPRHGARQGSGLRLVLGTDHRMRGAHATAGTPGGPLPHSITGSARSAATNPCTGISYGTGSAP